MSINKMQYNASDILNYPANHHNPTTQTNYANNVKNWVETEKNLVDTILWQPTTAYSVGNIVKTPSLPSQYCLVCTTAGTSGANEPSYSGKTVESSVSDGSVTWKVKEFSFSSLTHQSNSGSYSNGTDSTWKTAVTFSLAKGMWLISGAIGTAGNDKYLEVQLLDTATGYPIDGTLRHNLLMYIAKGDSTLPVNWTFELSANKNIAIQIKQSSTSSFAEWYFDAIKLA